MRLINALRRRGIRDVARKQWWRILDLWWDRLHNTTTSGFVDVADLKPERGDLAQAVHYEATKIGLVRHLLRQVPRSKRQHLVDFGSGEGRVLLVARQLGFARITGVEFSRSLVNRSRENIRQVRFISDASAIKVVCDDAVHFQIQSDHNVFFFYNPFGPDILNLVLDNIEASLEESPRQAWLIYVIPIHVDCVTLRTRFMLIAETLLSGFETATFRYSPGE